MGSMLAVLSGSQGNLRKKSVDECVDRCHQPDDEATFGDANVQRFLQRRCHRSQLQLCDHAMHGDARTNVFNSDGAQSTILPSNGGSSAISTRAASLSNGPGHMVSSELVGEVIGWQTHLLFN